MELKLGTAKIDITPQHPLPLAGFAHRLGVYEQVAEPIYARVFYFEQTNRQGETTTVIMVTADIIWWGNERVQTIQSKLAQAFGFEKRCIVLHATHNHSGPQTSEMFAPSLGEIDRRYIHDLEKRVMRAIDIAKNNVEPVTLERGSAEYRMGIHRRRLTENGVIMGPNQHGPCDPEVTLIRFKKSSGETKGLIVHYTCHPTTTDDNVLSPEFPGVCARLIETTLGKDCVVGYFQGCCGDVRPALVRNDEFYRGSYDHAWRIGQQLADIVLDKLAADDWVTLLVSNLQIRLRTVNLSCQGRQDLQELKALLQSSNALLREWSRTLLKNPDRLKESIPFIIGYVNFGDALSLLWMNGEVVVDYGLFIKNSFGKRVLPIPYSNGMIGYVPTAQQITEGGYEAKESIYYFGLSAPFATSIEADIKHAITEIVGGENENESL